MSTVIRFSVTEERKAIPILFRRFSGTILPNRTYVLSHEAVRALEEAGIRFKIIGSENNPPRMEAVPAGERI
jgi:hypothetical protein